MHRTILKSLAVAGVLLVVSGCARTVTLPDGTKVPKDEYRAGQAEAHNERIARELFSAIQDCPESMTEVEAVQCRDVNIIMMLAMPQVAEQLTANNGYWQYRAQRRQFWMSIAQLAVNNPVTQALAFKWIQGGSSSGSSVKITADGESRIENIDMTNGNQSPFITGADNVVSSGGSNQATDAATAANREGKIQFGDGSIQGEAFTDPPLQNEAPVDSSFGPSISQ